MELLATVTDSQFTKLVHNIAKSDPVQRAIWMANQPPLLLALDERDAEDDPEPANLNTTPQKRCQTP